MVSKCHVVFTHNEMAQMCYVSQDIYQKFGSDVTPFYLGVRLASYSQDPNSTIVINCMLDTNLKENSIQIPARYFNVINHEIAVDFLYVQPVQEVPPLLQKLVILLNRKLYDKLLKLESSKEWVEFLRQKFGVYEKETVVFREQVIATNWCKIIDCYPYEQGIIDFDKTEITFVRDNTNNKLNNIAPTSVHQLENIRVKCLNKPIPNELILPKQDCNSDDSLFAFTTFDTLSKLNITSGSYVELKSATGSYLVKLFLLLEPHSFENSFIFVGPRVMACFKNDTNITVKKLKLDLQTLPLAASVSVARVCDWYQSQKVYQNLIISKLKQFLTENKRILRVGDLISIPFDSSTAIFFNNSPTTVDIASHNDACVWFRIQEAYFDNYHEDNDAGDNSINKYFTIDPENFTKLMTTSIVAEESMTLSTCDMSSFYETEPIVHYNQKDFPFVNRSLNIMKSAFKTSTLSSTRNTTILLHSTTRSTGKSTLVRFLANMTSSTLVDIDCTTLTNVNSSLDSTSKTIGYIKAKMEGVLRYSSQSIVYLSHLDVLFSQVDPNQEPELNKISKNFIGEFIKMVAYFTEEFSNVVFIASTNDIDCIPSSLRSVMKFEIEVPVPTERQRKEIFQWYLSPNILNRGNAQGTKFKARHNISYSKLALQSAGLTPIDIKSIVRTAKAESLQQDGGSNHIWLKNFCEITMDHLDKAINKARDEFSVSIGAPKIPNVTWEDIGGVDLVKGEIMDTIDMPLKHPELFATGMKKRSGILFYGPPGTGKTLMAKAIASNFSLNFFSVKGPELLNMYIGESEANVRKVFQRAREAKPCVIFFDEIDSVAPKRGNQGDSGGVMDRIVSQLLAELDGMSSDGDGVFVIGATNRPDLLDEALLRPGRFDKLLYLGIPDTNSKQINILKALTRKFQLDSSINLSQVAELCPFNYTGADFYALCSDAMLNAMTRVAAECDAKLENYNKDNNTNISMNYWLDRHATDQDIDVFVKMQDFVKAQKELTPSVSEDELNHYLSIKKNFEA